MWEPPKNIELHDAYFEVSKKLSKSRWYEFACRGLKLDLNEIDNIQENYRNDIQQQKIKMCTVWAEGVGCKASVALLYQALNHFLFPEQCPPPDFTRRASVTKLEKVSDKDRNTGHTANVIKIEIEEQAEDLEGYCSRVEDNFEVKPCSAKFYEERSKEDFIYKLAGMKGHVIIINNNFSGRWKREGSEVDVKNMERLWRELGCQVNKRSDLSGEEIETALKGFAKDPIIYDYYVVIIMSHGTCKDGEGIVYGNDRVGELKIKHICELFNNKSCKELMGKPKLIFMQCCRGDVADTGVVKADAMPISKDCTGSEIEHHTFPDGKLLTQSPIAGRTVADAHVFDEEQKVKESVAMKEIKVLPTQSDVLIAFPTQDGMKAFRHTVHGSWFINAITNVFKNCAKDTHVLDLMTRVNNVIANKCCNGPITAKAMSQVNHSLTKNLYLFPGIDVQMSSPK